MNGQAVAAAADAEASAMIFKYDLNEFISLFIYLT